MSSEPFSRLNPINLLQTFVTQSLELSEPCKPGNNDKPINKIEQLGLNAGGCFEAAYREERGLVGPRWIMPNTAQSGATTLFFSS